HRLRPGLSASSFAYRPPFRPSATALKAVLGAQQPAPNPDEPPDPAEDALAAAVAARGKQPNLSFFAFTATPKARTLELFGRYDRSAEHTSELQSRGNLVCRPL